MEQIPFQIEAVDKLVANIKRLWDMEIARFLLF